MVRVLETIIGTPFVIGLNDKNIRIKAIGRVHEYKNFKLQILFLKIN